MGKINMNMNKVKETTVNSTEIKESTDVKSAEASIESAELTDDTSVNHEDINEIKQENADSKNEETKAEIESNGTVIVRYVGGGAWIDEKGCYWANENKSDNILHERQYSKSEYESREDIKFMVAYGAMESTIIGE